MKFTDMLMIVVLLLVLGIGIYIMFEMVPKEAVILEVYDSEIIANLSLKSKQFYLNMRYESNKISYQIEPACDDERKERIVEALNILTELTVLSFQEKKNGAIRFVCSQLSPNATNEGHFVAGEGGPVEIVNASKYSLIKSARVALYRDEQCDEPKIAIHEILHALGFDHNSNKTSIMYPITDCKQKIDLSIIEDITEVYSEPALPDLAILRVEANKTDKYLNFNIQVINAGLTDSYLSNVSVYADNRLIRQFELGKVEVGSRKSIAVTNLNTKRDFKEVRFVISSEENELDFSNNAAKLNVV